MERIAYDLIFGMGQACGCSQTLRRAGLQFLSFPGDWTAPVFESPDYPAFEHDFRNRCETLISPPADFFAGDDFVKQIAVSNTGKQVYVNGKTRYVFNHDFTIGNDFETELPHVIARYRKRRERLLELIRSSKRVLVVRIDIPEGKYPASLDDGRYVRRRLSEAFPGVTFDVALLSYDKTIPFEKRTYEEVEAGLYHLAFNFYDHQHALPNQPALALTSAALAEHFAVTDYRSDEERMAFVAHEKEAKAKKRALKRAKNLNRLKALWFSRFNPIADLIARRLQCKFDQIAILGFNCETAFRFYNRWGFLDSSLFAWANTIDIMTLTRALERFDRLGKEGFEFHAPSRMWQCTASKIYFHGRMKAHAGDPKPTAEQLAADLQDLTERVAHLKEKFLRYLTNEKTTLLAYRLGDEAAAPALDNKINALEKALKKLGATNCKLLFVTTRKTLHLMPAGENRIFRAVNAFNPPDDVTSRKKGDSANWNRIWSEFAPKTILPKKHAFKFEDL